MNDLIEFLTRCNDEDVEAATKASQNKFAGMITAEWGDHWELHSPARVLRECAARRRLIARAQHAANSQAQFHLPGGHEVLKAYDDAILVIVQSYVDRPGFKDEWRVT